MYVVEVDALVQKPRMLTIQEREKKSERENERESI